MAKWVLLTYRVPREPSAARVSVWRRLRRLGAVLLHDSVWALPLSSFTREQAQWLASEVKDLGGDCLVWLAEPFPAATDADLVGAFEAQAKKAFQAIVAKAKGGGPTAALSRAFQEACRVDYFRSPHREEARRALLENPATERPGGGAPQSARPGRSR